MEYCIAIPSHRRADLLKNTTLAYLRSTDVDMERVSVFVSDAQDCAAYSKAMPDVDIVLRGHPITTVTEKFNVIHQYYDLGQQVLVMEDDVKLVTGGDSGPGSNDGGPLVAFDAFARKAFAQIPDGGIWGIAPHSNTFFFSGKVTRTLKLVVAHCFGFISTQDPALEVTQLGKSDYERTCLYFNRYGETVRMDMVGVKTKSYTQAGGTAANFSKEQRVQLEQESCDYLVRRYPHLLRANVKKKSQFAELSFQKCTYSADALAQIQAITDKELGYAPPAGQ